LSALRSWALACSLLVAGAAFAAEVTARPAAEGVRAPVQVLLLGAYHMANPGLDAVSVKIDSVLTAQRQRELADVAQRLARFKPNKIAVEMQGDLPGLALSAYQRFTPEALLKEPNEIDQIGFRLARQLGHASVYGIDEQSETIDYFPYDQVQAYARAHQQTDKLARGQALGQRLAKQMEEDQKTKSVRQMLLMINAPGYDVAEMTDYYYPLLGVGDAKEQPGAELNAAWYLRNLKIFTKLQTVVQAGDRVLVLYGAGHNFWLRHLLRHTPGFVLVDPAKVLK
jgi:hypothetical protein